MPVQEVSTNAVARNVCDSVSTLIETRTMMSVGTIPYITIKESQIVFKRLI